MNTDNNNAQTIADLAIAYTQNSSLNNLIVVPKDYKLENLEQYSQVPNLYRAKFTTAVLSDFISYCIKHANAVQCPSVFVDLDKMSAKAIFDMGTTELPQWGKHSATLALIKTPEFSELITSASLTFNHQQFLDFVEDWKDNIAFFDDPTADIDHSPAAFLRHKNALRKLKSETTAVFEQQTEQYSASRSALESIEIKANDAKPPQGFVFSCQPYDGFLSVKLICQLRITSNKDKELQFKFRIMQLEAIKQSIAEEMRNKIKSQLSENINIHIGQMSYQ